MTRIAKLLIANRGEIVVRIARTCRELGVGSVAVFSDADDGALHVDACDEAVRIGGDTPATSYLRIDAVIAAAQRVGADAIHPGFGFLAERADAARAVQEAGLLWVGPTPDVISRMGDKLAAKRMMEEAGVPVLPSVAVDPGDRAGILAATDRIGLPVMVKAAAGGGGTGMREVQRREDVVDAVSAAFREAEAAFGDGTVFLERLVVRPRHVEVQIMGDGTDVIHLGERDCSVQRRHQKVVEEAPAPALAPGLVARLREAAVTAGLAMAYTNAGTVEFIVDDRDDARQPFAFLEVNTRLQVEHPVTEAVTGLDLVAMQLALAEGRSLAVSQDQVRVDGHAIEARLYAENPANDYLPVAGTLAVFRPAEGVGVRWDVGVREGGAVSAYYDPTISKVIAHGPDRRTAAARLAAALRATAILGLVTNRDLLVGVLEHPAFLEATVSTAFLDEHFGDPGSRFHVPDRRTADLAVIVTVLWPRLEAGRPVPAGWSNTGLGVERITVDVAGRRCTAEVELGGRTRVRVVDDEADVAEVAWQEVTHHERSGDRLHLEVDGLRTTARVAVDGDDVQVVLADANVTLRLHPRFPRVELVDEPGTSRAPMPGAVVSVAVAEGDVVAAGDLLAIVEAMKMEHRIVADVPGRVTAVAVASGDQVGADDLLIVVEPDE